MKIDKSKYLLVFALVFTMAFFSCSKGDEPVPVVETNSAIDSSSMREGDIVDEEDQTVTSNGKDGGAGVSGDGGEIVGGDDNEDDDDVDVKGDVIGGSNGTGGGVNGGNVSGGGR